MTWRRRTAAAMLGVGLALPPATSASAATPAAIQHYAATGVVERDGSLQAVVDIEVEGSGGPGPTIPLPQRDEVDGDTAHWRPLEITNLTLSSVSGAPSDAEVQRTDAALVVHVAPRSQIGGTQHYVLSYTVAPALESATAAGDVVRWPLLASGHKDPIRGVSATLQGPSSLGALTCTAGSAACTRQTNQSGRSAEFEQTEVAPQQAFRVGVDLAPHTLAAGNPKLAPRGLAAWHAGLVALVVAGVVVAGIAAWVLRRRSKRSLATSETPPQKG